MRSLDSPRAIVAVILLFAYNGLVIGVYAAAIPILREKMSLDPLRLAALFVLTGAAAVATMQVSGRVVDSHGARRICLAMIVPLMLAATGYALAPTYPLLLVAGALLGIGNGGIDVAMNALAVQVERHRMTGGKGPIMSFFHGMWAIGCFLGSLAISLVGTVIGLSPVHTLLACASSVAAVAVLVWVLAYLVTPETEPVAHVTTTGRRAPVPRAAYLMGLMAIAFGLGEGTASDWSGTHVATVAGVDPRTAAWAVTAMTACMVAIRLSGDRLVTLLGRRVLVRAGGTVAALGYLVATLVDGFPLLVAGWALVGLGTGVIAPQVYAVAGHMAGGRGLAVVTTFGYTTFLVGPAVIGALIHAVGIHHAMAAPAILLVCLVGLAGIAMRDVSEVSPPLDR
ncbi:MAG: MFS transporter [Propionibacteriaceae bacterium]|nr:MFS transporter [Propionibacteriaceae bacterium]